jgi:hypothetical protein
LIFDNVSKSAISGDEGIVSVTNYYGDEFEENEVDGAGSTRALSEGLLLSFDCKIVNGREFGSYIKIVISCPY